jgi:hypothetical protein
MSAAFDYDYKINIHGLHEGFVYRSVGDAPYMFSSDVKLHNFLRFMMFEMKGYAEWYKVGKIDALPFVNVTTQGGSKFIGFDYYFFIQCVCRYLVRIADKESAIAFERDFLIGADKGLNRNKAVMLFYMYFQLAADLTYASSLGKKATVGYVNYSLETVYKYNDKSIEMHLISFNLEKLSNYIYDEKMMQSLESLGSIFEAEQVAFGGYACMEYWKKSKLKPHYFLSRNDIFY